MHGRRRVATRQEARCPETSDQADRREHRYREKRQPPRAFVSRSLPAARCGSRSKRLDRSGIEEKVRITHVAEAILRLALQTPLHERA